MIKEFNEETLFLLCNRNIITYVSEYGLYKNDWFFLRRHFLNGQYFDIDVTHDFAILRGVDAHRVIYHSVWNGFLHENDEYLHGETTFYTNYEEYMYLPHLQGLEFYSEYFGQVDSNNISHPFILGMTTHDLVQVPYFEQVPGIACQTSNRNDVGKTRKFEVVINSTFCPQKREYYVSAVVSYARSKTTARGSWRSASKR